MFKRMNVNFRRVLLVLGCLPLAAAIAFAQTDGAGNAYSFNGTTANYISDDAFSNFPSNAITIEFWMRTSDTPKAGTPFSYAVSGEDNMLFIHDYRDLRFRLGGTAIPASGGTGAVGLTEIDRALTNGQVHALYVTSAFVNEHAEEAMSAIRRAFDESASVEHVSGEGAERLDAAGGVAARLRFVISPEHAEESPRDSAR